MCCHTCWHHVRVFDLDYTSNQKYIHELGWWVGGWVGGWVGVWVGGLWVVGNYSENNATSWLHLASWNLPDSQLS